MRVRNLENDTEPVIACTGVFPFIGSEPNSAFMAGCVALENGYVVTNDRFESSVPGIFAVGGVRKGYSGQLADALLEGRSAAAAACVD